MPPSAAHSCLARCCVVSVKASDNHSSGHRVCSQHQAMRQDTLDASVQLHRLHRELAFYAHALLCCTRGWSRHEWASGPASSALQQVLIHKAFMQQVYPVFSWLHATTLTSQDTTCRAREKEKVGAGEGEGETTCKSCTHPASRPELTPTQSHFLPLFALQVL